MTSFTKFAAFFILAFVTLCYHPIPNDIVSWIFVLVSLVGYAFCSRLASKEEQKLKDRIKALEDKAENNAEYIHKLSKKQSDKTIEYHTD